MSILLSTPQDSIHVWEMEENLNDWSLASFFFILKYDPHYHIYKLYDLSQVVISLVTTSSPVKQTLPQPSHCKVVTIK